MPRPSDLPEFNGLPLRCPLCDGSSFKRKNFLLNTTALSFIGYEFLDNEAITFTCNHCKHMLWFERENPKWPVQYPWFFSHLSLVCHTWLSFSWLNSASTKSKKNRDGKGQSIAWRPREISSIVDCVTILNFTLEEQSSTPRHSPPSVWITWTRMRICSFALPVKIWSGLVLAPRGSLWPSSNHDSLHKGHFA